MPFQGTTWLVDQKLERFKPLFTGLPMGQVFRGSGVAAFELQAENSCGFQLPACDHHLLVCRTRHRSLVHCEVDGRSISGDTLPGEICLVPEQNASEWRLKGPQDTLCLLVDTAIIAEAARGAELPQEALQNLQIRRSLFTADPALHQIVLLLFTELRRRDVGGDVSIEALGRLLAVHLIRRYSSARSLDDQPPGLPLHKLRTVLDFIARNYTENLEIMQLASLVKMTPFYFLRLFKQSTGKTPHQYLLHSRIERAKEMLAADEANLADIALELGFANQSHFGTTFRKIAGSSPKQYKLRRLNWREQPQAGWGNDLPPNSASSRKM